METLFTQVREDWNKYNFLIESDVIATFSDEIRSHIPSKQNLRRIEGELRFVETVA
jgi:hypothetical protein